MSCRTLPWIAVAVALGGCAGAAARPAPPAVSVPPKKTVPARATTAPVPIPPRQESEERVGPCRKATTELAAAEAAVDALDKDVLALAPAGDPKPLERSLTALLQTPCFALALGDGGDAGDLVFESPLSLQRWWSDGGEAWLRHFLELGNAPGEPNDPVWSWVPPTPRTALTRESKNAGALLPLLCPAKDESCGRETLGWLLRARSAFDAHARGRTRGEAAVPDPLEHCRAKATAAPAATRYDAWRDCLALTTVHVDELPLGRFRAPTEGWLVLRGRRGHYTFCDEVRAYDLATGSAWTNGTCSNLALREDGSVDGAATNAKRVPRTTVGRLPLENLREAALLTFLSSHAQNDVVREGYARALPEDVKPERTSPTGRGLGMSASFSSGQTTVAWSWHVKGAVVVSGELTYPNDYNHAVSDHAVTLLQIAEAAFVPLGASECTAAVPPATLAFDAQRARACGPARPR